MVGTGHTPTFLAGDGEMAKLIREFDWARTSLGDPMDWPPALREITRMMLTTRHPALILWGSDSVCLYNDGYRRSLGLDKHPGILGSLGRAAWPESWDVMAPQVESVMNGGAPTWQLNHRVPLLRDGMLEDIYWTYSVSPIDDPCASSGVGGVLVLCTDTTSHIQRAHELAREHVQFARLFEQAPSFMALLSGPEHVFAMINPAYMQLVGTRDLLGKPITQALPEASRQGYVELLDRVYRTGCSHEGVGVQYRVEPPDAQPHWVTLDFVFQPVRDGQGDVTGIFVLGADVTARHDALQQLSSSEEQLRLATEGGGVGLWDVDLLANTLYWTPRTREMFGIHSDRAISLRDFYEGLHPADFAAVTQAFSAVTVPGSGATYDVEYRTIGREDGQVRWVAARGVPVVDAQGRVARVVGSVIDITRRKHDEHRIQELNDALEQRLSLYLSERKLFGDLVEGTDAYVQVSDHNYNWMAINEAAASEFERIYGVRPKVGDNMLAVLADVPEHQAAVKAVWQRALAGEEFTDTGLFGETGRSRHYEMHFRSLHSRDGRRIGAYQFVYDVTERIEKEEHLARTEAALAQAQKMEAIGQLVGGIAHDFNNLLQAIRGNFDILTRRPDDASLVLRCAQKGQSVSERAAKLTSQLLAFSREHVFDLRPVCLSLLLDDLESLFRTTMGSRVVYQRDTPAHEVCVEADRVQLEMALLNLVINARDAMEGTGHLRLAVREEGEQVSIAVADDGAGMSPEVLARCFDPFFTTKGVGKGSGLGLSQVYGMSKRVGGTVSLHSELGIGTTVTLTLNRAQPDPEPRPEFDDSEKHDARRHHVLVVDDDPDVRAFLCDAVRSLGHEVASASDGREALRILGSERVDLLMADFSMPHMDGAELARHALALRPGLRIVFASGHPDADAFEAALGREAVVLRKPFDLNALRRTLNSQFADAV